MAHALWLYRRMQTQPAYAGPQQTGGFPWLAGWDSSGHNEVSQADAVGAARWPAET
jgi:hypothetical protein